MKVVLSWLRELCPVDLEAEGLADLLSVKGVHVEGIERPWAGLDGVVVARVVEVRDHPNSDKLCLARVSTGSGEQEVVVGVRNMEAGDLVPLAGPGARVPALDQPLGRREIRGVVSNGMLCSPWELAITQTHTGILILPPDSPVGADFKDLFGLDDAVLDIEIEPNRPDLMSVFGVAREVAAATGLPLTEPSWSVEESAEAGKADEVATVEVLDLERCPRYLARVIRGVGIGPSPIRVQARLTATGMRPLSNVVDATNYAMLEMGQPLHPFDLDLLAGHGIIVRRAADGERLVTLDDVERVLTAEDLVIADHEKAVAIAGVMGSAPAEVHPHTRDVLLESAYFWPKGVIRTSRRLGLQTEASMRFGRGADPENPPRGADLAARLIAEWAGGQVLAGRIDAGEPPERRRLAIRPARASLVLGYEVTPADAREVFDRLGITVTEGGSAAVEIEVPSYRVDLEREVDLIEEIVRIQGYDGLGTTLPSIKHAGGYVPTYAFRRRAREALVRAGVRESISLSFASNADLELMGDVGKAARVANPVSAEEGWLRTSLIPNLLKSLERNLYRGVRSVALFEAGHVFRAGDPIDEREHVAATLTGPAARGLIEEPRSFDFFDAKGALEALMDGLAVRRWDLGGPADRPYHPSRSAEILAAGERVGLIGELHPNVAQRFDLPDRVAALQVDLTALAPHADQPFEYRDVPRFPPVRRDLAFVVDAAVPVGTMRTLLIEAGGDLVGSVELFDLFTGSAGSSVPEGKKNVGFAVEFRAPDRTLTDREVDRTVEAIRSRLTAEVGAELRTG